MGTERRRKAIITKILSIITYATTQGKAIGKSKLTAQICIDEGVTQKKADEYVDLLIRAEKVLESDEGLEFIGDEVNV